MLGVVGQMGNLTAAAMVSFGDTRYVHNRLPVKLPVSVTPRGAPAELPVYKALWIS